MSPVPVPAPAATADRPASVRTPHASVTDGRPPAAVAKAAAEGRTV